MSDSELQKSGQPEPVVEPDLPIVDAHHHFKDLPRGPRYLFPDFLQDLQSGHNIIATVVIEVGVMYRAGGAEEYRPVGETEFFNGNAAMFASGNYGFPLACAGIVSFADLSRGADIAPVLDAHIAASGGRLRGIRVPAAWSAQYNPARLRYTGSPVTEHLLRDFSFRKGFACLEQRNLSFDVHAFHTQIPDIVDLAQAFPSIRIVVNHCCSPLGLGPNAGKWKEVFIAWREQMRVLARCSNVYMKLGGLRWAGIRIADYPIGEQGEFQVQPSSSAFADAWRPYFETCIETLGVKRCMFESNFPPESVVCSYRTIWNAFKRATAGYSVDERTALFSGTAADVYRLAIPAKAA